MSDPLADAPRPTSWTVFGIINLVFGVFGLLGGLFALLVPVLPRPAGAENPVLKLLDESAAYRVFYWISTPLGVAASVLLGVAGIGLLRNRSWGRALSLAYAWYGLVAALVGVAATWFLVLQPLLARIDGESGVARMAMLVGVIGGGIGSLAAFVYPAVLLVFMRTDARALALPQGPAQPDNPYEAPRT
jgi:hypothetical protein